MASLLEDVEVEPGQDLFAALLQRLLRTTYPDPPAGYKSRLAGVYAVMTMYLATGIKLKRPGRH